MPGAGDVLDRWMAALAARPVSDPLALLAKMLAAECDLTAEEAHARGLTKVAEEMDAWSVQMDGLAASRRKSNTSGPTL